MLISHIKNTTKTNKKKFEDKKNCKFLNLAKCRRQKSDKLHSNNFLKLWRASWKEFWSVKQGVLDDDDVGSEGMVMTETISGMF